MRRKLISQEILSTGGTLVAPEGTRVRIIAVIAIVAGLVEGDAFSVQYTRSGQLLSEATSEQLSSTVLRMTAAIGLNNSSSRLSIIDPVTGVVSYVGTVSSASTALPDIWWPYSITIAASFTSGAVNATVLYEIEEVA